MSLYEPPTAPAPKGIPNLVHFVYGYKGDQGELFPYYAYLAVRSAIVNLKPDEILLSVHQVPHIPFTSPRSDHQLLVRRMIV